MITLVTSEEQDKLIALRDHLKKTALTAGPLHSYWDIIHDIEAVLNDRPTLLPFDMLMTLVERASKEIFMDRLEHQIASLRDVNSKRALAGKGYGKMSLDATLHVTLIHDISPVYSATIEGRTIYATSFKKLLEAVSAEYLRLLEGMKENADV